MWENFDSLSPEGKQELSGKIFPIMKKLEATKIPSIDEVARMSVDELQRWFSISNTGHILLFWKWILYWERNFGKTKFYKEQISPIVGHIVKQTKTINLLREIVNIWSEEAFTVAWGTWFKWARNTHTNIQTAVKVVDDKIGKLTPTMSKSETNTLIEDIFSAMKKWEQEKSIIWSDDMQSVKNIFLDQDLSIEKKRVQIYNTMRYGWWSWNSKGVKEVIEEHLLVENNDFEPIRSKSRKINLALSEKNEEKLKELVWEELWTKYYNLLQKTEQGLKNTPVMSEVELEKCNKKRVGSGNPPITMEQCKSIQREWAINKMSRQLIWELVYQKVANLENRWWVDSLTGVYANIVWLGETTSSDWYTIADENIDTCISTWTILALSVITMWSWMLVMSGSRLAVMAIWESIWVSASSFWTTASFIWWAVLDGTTFYWGAHTAWNLILKEDNFFEWNGDIKEISKSILFMWALHAVSWTLPKVIKEVWATKLWKITVNGLVDASIPINRVLWTNPEMLSSILKWIWEPLWEWAMLYFVSGLVDFAFGEWWHPNLEEYIQFVLLAWMFSKFNTIKNQISGESRIQGHTIEENLERLSLSAH